MAFPRKVGRERRLKKGFKIEFKPYRKTRADLKKKRILFVENNTDRSIGGSYYSLLYLVEGLNKDKYEAVVIFCDYNALVPMFRKAAKRVIIFNSRPCSSWPVKNLSDLIKYVPRLTKYVIIKQWPLLKLLWKIQPDLVHLNNCYDMNHDWMLACFLAGVKVISHDRGTRPPFSLQTRLFVRILDGIICVSDAFLQNVLRNRLKPRLCRRVYNGLDATRQVSIVSRSVIRTSLGVSAEQLLIGMVGNIDFWKGQKLFAMAMKRVFERCTSAMAIIVGETVKGAENYESEIKKYIEQTGIADRISLLGFRSDIADIMQAIDIFVHASVVPEPFGRVIIEAMAASKPIVATNAGGPAEIIVDGLTGRLVPLNDFDAMAEAILFYISNPNIAFEHGAKGNRRLKEIFSAEAMVRGVEGVYKDVFSTCPS